jgi:hypothetical protein
MTEHDEEYLRERRAEADAGARERRAPGHLPTVRPTLQRPRKPAPSWSLMRTL